MTHPDNSHLGPNHEGQIIAPGLENVSYTIFEHLSGLTLYRVSSFTPTTESLYGLSVETVIGLIATDINSRFRSSRHLPLTLNEQLK